MATWSYLTSDISQPGGTGTSFTKQYPVVIPKQVLMVAFFSFEGVNPVSVSDDFNGSWTQISYISDVGSNQSCAMFYCINQVAGQPTVTFTSLSHTWRGGIIAAYRGLVGSFSQGFESLAPGQIVGVLSDTTTTPSSGNTAAGMRQANELVIGCCAITSTSGAGAPTSADVTVRQSAASNGSDTNSMALGDKVGPVANSTTSATFTTDSALSAVICAAFRISSPVPVVIPLQQRMQ
jgi:hypothetical protein